MSDDRAQLCVRGENHLQSVLHRGLGGQWRVGDHYAWAPAGAPHQFLLGALTLTSKVSPASLADVGGIVCDSFAEFDAKDMTGRRGEAANPWMYRHPATLSESALPGEVRIRRATSDADVARWEQVVFEANGQEPDPPGELHPAGSQRQPGLSLLLAEQVGAPVGAAMGLVGELSVVVSAVAVLPPMRGAGLGTALTQRVLALAPDLPATLTASELSYGIYGRLGFVEVGRPVHWTKWA